MTEAGMPKRGVELAKRSFLLAMQGKRMCLCGKELPGPLYLGRGYCSPHCEEVGASRAGEERESLSALMRDLEEP